MSTLANQPAAVADGTDEFDGTQSLLKRVVGLQAFWILGVLIVICMFFTLIAGDRFLSTGNFSLISHSKRMFGYCLPTRSTTSWQ